MRAIINALPLRAGGGRIVGIEVARHLKLVAPEDSFLVLATRGIGYEELASDRVEVSCMAWEQWNMLRRLYFLNVQLPKLYRNFQADALFMPGNMPSLRGRINQLASLHRPYLVYPELLKVILPQWPSRFKEFFIRGYFRWAIRHKRVKAITVSTETMRDRLIRIYGAPPTMVTVVENSSIQDHQASDEPFRPNEEHQKRLEGSYKLLYLTRYYPHKNLEILPEVAHALRERGQNDIVMITTVAGDESKQAREWWSKVQKDSLRPFIVNIGPVPYQQVFPLHLYSDALFMPTKMEALSLSYLESMHAGKPILTSDRDFAREICGPAALYFDPDDPEAIVDSIIRLRESPGLAERLVSEGHRWRKNKYRDWMEITADYVKLLHRIVSIQNSVSELK